MKNKILFSILVILILIGIVRFTQPTENKGPQRVEDVIWRMFSSAKTGNIQQYLDCFSGPPLATLQADWKRNKDAAFRDYIKRDAQDIKGLSIINGRMENSQQAVFEVEVVYSDRNENQTFTLQKGNGKWKVVKITRPTLLKQPIPYLEQVVK